MSARLVRCFEQLREAGAGAFIPFFMLGDPNLETSAGLMRAAIAAGADALELGIPFSDPIADGPVIQAAAQRALAMGVTPDDCFALIAQLRREHPQLPLNLLTYANLVFHRDIDTFYRAAADAGLDSVLVADVPLLEAAPFAQAARAHAVAPVLIAPPDMGDERVAQLAQQCAGYTYCVARVGVTGADDEVRLRHQGLLAKLKRHGAPPAVLGFGISQPRHVRAALETGAAGVISGSAVIQRIAERLERPDDALAAVGSFVAEMKAATLPR